MREVAISVTGSIYWFWPGIKNRLGLCSGSLLRERETQQGFWWSCVCVWVEQTGTLRSLARFLHMLLVEFLRKQDAESEICIWRLTGESSEQCLRERERENTSMRQKKLSRDTCSFAAMASASLPGTLKLGWPFRDVPNWGKGVGPLDLNQVVNGCRLSPGDEDLTLGEAFSFSQV